ncbi:MAG: SUMF1/EgtB/PvdO family nonheme iron enzyme [Myxococcota bacterium]
MLFLLLACTDPVDTLEMPDTDGTDAPSWDTSFDVGDPWIGVVGGLFEMGSPEGDDIPANQNPMHTVNVPSFALMRHEVRVVDYEDCVADGGCTPRPENCYGTDRPNRPVNCVTWSQATDFCAWYGGRLPTESEWEFAATNRGAGATYPWGEEEPDCTRVNVGNGQGTPDCGAGMWDVCTHPLGDSPLGFCELAGNAFEWTQDWFWPTYDGHPTDGSARDEMADDFKVMRGGGIGSGVEPTTRERTFHPVEFYYGGMGVRCAMDP